MLPSTPPYSYQCYITPNACTTFDSMTFDSNVSSYRRSDVMGDDGTPTMGYLCLNAPNMFRINVATPLAQLRAYNVNSLAFPEIGSRYALWPSSLSDNAFIRINLTERGFTGNVPLATYYVSFRRVVRGGYDAFLQSAYNKRVYVHAFNGTAWVSPALHTSDICLDFLGTWISLMPT